MKQIISLLGTLLVMTAFLGCSKKDDGLPIDVTYWVVNNDTIAYRNVIVNTAPTLTELRVIAPLPSENMLSVAFQMDSLPHFRTYKVDYIASDPGMCNVYVSYKGVTYNVDPAHNTTTVRVSTLFNGKGKYELEPTWFYKDLSPSDSILVKGIIIEP